MDLEQHTHKQRISKLEAMLVETIQYKYWVILINHWCTDWDPTIHCSDHVIACVIAQSTEDIQKAISIWCCLYCAHNTTSKNLKPCKDIINITICVHSKTIFLFCWAIIVIVQYTVYQTLNNWFLKCELDTYLIVTSTLKHRISVMNISDLPRAGPLRHWYRKNMNAT